MICFTGVPVASRSGANGSGMLTPCVLILDRGMWLGWRSFTLVNWVIVVITVTTVASDNGEERGWKHATKSLMTDDLSRAWKR